MVTLTFKISLKSLFNDTLYQDILVILEFLFVCVTVFSDTFFIPKVTPELQRDMQATYLRIAKQSPQWRVITRTVMF